MRDYAQEHRFRKAITPEAREAREKKRDAKNAVKIAAGEIAWSVGNRKLRKLGTIGFDIPAGVAKDRFNTCPAKGECAAWCFARQGFYVFPHVRAAHERNLAIVRGDLDRFVGLAVRDLTTRFRKIETVRVHDSGDFFSAPYLNAWFLVAKACPEKRFYAYTKMFAKLAATFAKTPPNFWIVQSFGGVDDAKVNLARPHARVFVSHADRVMAGYVDGTETDRPAMDGVVKIGLVYHSGGRKLTDSQASALRVLPEAP